jgi:adenylosuccinate synthase
VTEIVVVFRTFPIRVAGQQAGPLNDEITWEQLQLESGYPYPIEERTSVTHKVRRIARFDWDLAKRSVWMNYPTRIAINGLDYLNASNRGVSHWDELTREASAFVAQLEDMTHISCSLLGTGPSLTEIISRSDRQQAIHPDPALIQA